MPLPISAYMLTRDNERSVERALRSLAFADEIVVVDSHSGDRTPEIARACGARVIQRPWPGFREQYQFAADQCQHEWALFLDADEEIAAPLAAEMRAALEANAARPTDEQVQGFHLHRRTFYLDRWILHGGWLPDYEVRLYHRPSGNWQGALHAKIHVNGRVAHLHHFVYHYTYDNLSEQLRTIDDYSSTAAADLDSAGGRFRLFRLLLNPPFRFLKEYLLKRGFLDGMPGLIIAVNTMFYVFNKHAKLWERQRCRPGLVAERKAQKPE